jgi:hypothetical protein
MKNDLQPSGQSSITEVAAHSQTAERAVCSGAACALDDSYGVREQPEKTRDEECKTRLDYHQPQATGRLQKRQHDNRNNYCIFYTGRKVLRLIISGSSNCKSACRPGFSRERALAFVLGDRHKAVGST